MRKFDPQTCRTTALNFSLFSRVVLLVMRQLEDVANQFAEQITALQVQFSVMIVYAIDS